MAEYNHDKLYFLKLPKGFFRRHDILILESLPNGKEYSLFYLKLMLESLDHDGYLRYSELIPYNAEMLASVTNTNIDIVRNAVQTLEQMQLLEVLDDKTIFMRKVESMTVETTVSAAKKQAQIANRTVGGGQGVENLPPEYRVQSTEYRNNKEIIKEKRSLFTPPQLKEVEDYCKERNNSVDAKRFVDFYTSKGWFVGKNKMKNWKAAVRTWESKEKADHGFQERHYSDEDMSKILADIDVTDDIEL